MFLRKYDSYLIPFAGQRRRELWYDGGVDKPRKGVVASFSGSLRGPFWLFWMLFAGRVWVRVWRRVCGPFGGRGRGRRVRGWECEWERGWEREWERWGDQQVGTRYRIF